jgi:hypothetical protein
VIICIALNVLAFWKHLDAFVPCVTLHSVAQRVRRIDVNKLRPIADNLRVVRVFVDCSCHNHVVDDLIKFLPVFTLGIPARRAVLGHAMAFDVSAHVGCLLFEFMSVHLGTSK